MAPCSRTSPCRTAGVGHDQRHAQGRLLDHFGEEAREAEQVGEPFTAVIGRNRPRTST